MGGASCRRPRTASSVGNPTLSTVKRVAEIAENAGIDGNEVLECSRVTGKTLAEIADIPCKYFARETVRSFTVSPTGCSPTSNERRKGRKGRKPRILREYGPRRRCRKAAETGGNWRKLVFAALWR